MEKTLVIDGRKVPFKCTGGFLLRYKELTGSDAIKDIYEINLALSGGKKEKEEKGKEKQEEKEKDIDLSKFDINVMYNLVWVLARTADPEVPDLLTWLDSFDDFPIFTVFSDLRDLIIGAFQSTKPVPKDTKKKATIQIVK